jgi:hypothetical protein
MPWAHLNLVSTKDPEEVVFKRKEEPGVIGHGKEAFIHNQGSMFVNSPCGPRVTLAA